MSLVQPGITASTALNPATLDNGPAIGPERDGGQGLTPGQEESGNLAIHKLLTSDDGRAWTDFVATYRHDPDGSGAYEAWARRGMVRWARRLAPQGGYLYEVVEVVGDNPLGRQDPRALATLEEELAAGRTPTDPQHAFIEPESLTYPHAYERVSQLFDSPNAPNLVVNPKSYAFGRQPGMHGALDVVQSRSPLVFSGPGVRRGERVDALPRQVDVAPTIAHLLGFPLIDGRDVTGRTSSERGSEPDVYLRRQDGRVIDDILDPSAGSCPERVYMVVLDGQSHTELLHRLDTESGSIPNLRRLIDGGSLLRWGSITNFPSITWPSHNAIITGAWCGHHDIVGPSYYLRDQQTSVSPQGQSYDTARFLGHGAETLFEACHRVNGSWNGLTGAFTASVNGPCTRGADHATFERRIVGDMDRLKELTAETEPEISPRWAAELQEHGHHTYGILDNRALAQSRQLLTNTSHPFPMLVYHEFGLTDATGHDYGPHHEGTREALDHSDRELGHVLRIFDEKGLFDSTLFVITTDHGMAIQDVSLRANPARIPERDGMAAITTEPFIYLRDLDLEIEVAPDGRTGRVTVYDNDLAPSGERRPVGGADVLVTDHRDGVVARVRTDAEGLAGFITPADLDPADLRMAVHANGFNSRHVLLDGTSLALDLRDVLYGANSRSNV